MPFMEPKDSLPCSQEPDTGPHPELDESTNTPLQIIHFRSILILYACVSQVLSSFQVFKLKFCMHI